MDYNNQYNNFQPYPPNNDKTGFGIAALVLSIVGMLLSCVWFLGIPLNLLAIIFGGVGLKNKNKGLAIAGLVIGIVGIVLSIIFGISLISDSATEYSYDYNFFNY